MQVNLIIYYDTDFEIQLCHHLSCQAMLFSRIFKNRTSPEKKNFLQFQG